MKGLIIALLALSLSGCAQWNKLSDPEKAAIIVSTAIVIGASVIADSNDKNIHRTCVSTRSIQTGCGDVDL